PPAAGAVFQARKLLQSLLVLDRVDVPAEEIPLAGGGAGRGGGRLPERIALGAVARSYHLPLARPELERPLPPPPAGLGRGPLDAEVRVPVLVRRHRELGDEVGGGAVAHGLIRQVHARVLEVIRLAERGGEELRAGPGIEQAARHAEAHLVRVAHTIRADVSV